MNALRVNLMILILILLAFIPLLVNSKSIPARNQNINNKNHSEQKSINKRTDTFVDISQTIQQAKENNIYKSSLFLRDQVHSMNEKR